MATSRIVGYILNEWARDFVANAHTKQRHALFGLNKRFGYIQSWPLFAYTMPNGEVFTEEVNAIYNTYYDDACGCRWCEEHPLLCLCDEQGVQLPSSLWANEDDFENNEIFLGFPY